MTTQIINDCLPIDFFRDLQGRVMHHAFMWEFVPALNEEQTNNEDTYFAHTAYHHDVPTSDFFNMVGPLRDYLPDFHCLIRIKINLYPRQRALVEHTPHRDHPYPHKGAILSLNTCDGYTRLEDQIVPSIENRLLIFDASQIHNSTSTTTPPGRFNININYL